MRASELGRCGWLVAFAESDVRSKTLLFLSLCNFTIGSSSEDGSVLIEQDFLLCSAEGRREIGLKIWTNTSAMISK